MCVNYAYLPVWLRLKSKHISINIKKKNKYKNNTVLSVCFVQEHSFFRWHTEVENLMLQYKEYMNFHVLLYKALLFCKIFQYFLGYTKFMPCKVIITIFRDIIKWGNWFSIEFSLLLVSAFLFHFLEGSCTNICLVCVLDFFCPVDQNNLYYIFTLKIWDM